MRPRSHFRLLLLGVFAAFTLVAGVVHLRHTHATGAPRVDAAAAPAAGRADAASAATRTTLMIQLLSERRSTADGALVPIVDGCAEASGPFQFNSIVACSAGPSTAGASAYSNADCQPSGYAGACGLTEYLPAYSCGNSILPISANCISTGPQNPCQDGYYLASPSACCPAGWMLSAPGCIPAGYSAPLSCPAGYALAGTSCVAYAYQPCPGGYYASGANCVPFSYSAVSYPTVAACPSGYVFNGASCLPPAYAQTYSCPAGYTLSGANCFPGAYGQPPSCSLGYRSGSCLQCPPGVQYSVAPIGGHRYRGAFMAGCY